MDRRAGHEHPRFDHHIGSCALGCSMDTFLRYFPAAESLYQVFLALAIGLILLNWIWQLFKNYFLGAGIEAEDPIKLSMRTFIFLFLAFYAKDIVDLLLGIAGTPYKWILTEDLPPLHFGDFNSVITVILGVCPMGCSRNHCADPGFLFWHGITSNCCLKRQNATSFWAFWFIPAPVAFATGASQSTRKYIQKLVPDVWRPVIFIADERMVSPALHFHGRHIPCKSTVRLMKGGRNETQETNLFYHYAGS